MHTPDQARGLWCPMVRIARHEVTEQSRPMAGGAYLHTEQHHIVGGCNTDALGAGNGEPRRMAHDYQPLASCRCIADKCAMWRWGEWRESREPKVVSVADSLNGITNAVEYQAVRHGLKGYCGIAGRPEVMA